MSTCHIAARIFMLPINGAITVAKKSTKNTTKKVHVPCHHAARIFMLPINGAITVAKKKAPKTPKTNYV